MCERSVRFIKRFEWFDGLTTNGQKSIIAILPTFALSLSKGEGGPSVVRLFYRCRCHPRVTPLCSASAAPAAAVCFSLEQILLSPRHIAAFSLVLGLQFRGQACRMLDGMFAVLFRQLIHALVDLRHLFNLRRVVEERILDPCFGYKPGEHDAGLAKERAGLIQLLKLSRRGPKSSTG